jgi:hypothetical protein
VLHAKYPKWKIERELDTSLQHLGGTVFGRGKVTTKNIANHIILFQFDYIVQLIIKYLLRERDREGYCINVNTG